jgi:superfamily II DNA or RNA helicase
MTSSAYTYTKQDVTATFGTATMRKASSYMQAISQLQINPNEISAKVQGSVREPYRVRLTFSEQDGKTRLLTQCTCSVGETCKHGAALALVALQRRQAIPAVTPGVLQWMDTLQRSASPTRSRAKVTHAIYYLLGPAAAQDGVPTIGLRLLKGRIEADGQVGRGTDDWDNIERAIAQTPQFVDVEDLDIFRLIQQQTGRQPLGQCKLFTGQPGAALINQLLNSERVFLTRQPLHEPLRSQHLIPLRHGAARPGQLIWLTDRQQKVTAQLRTTPTAAQILPVEPAWYIDNETGEVGPVECAIDAKVLAGLLIMPPLSQADLPLVVSILQEVAPNLPLPEEMNVDALPVIDAMPQPALKIGTLRSYAIYAHRNYLTNFNNCEYDYAQPFFRYGEVSVAIDDDSEYFVLDNGQSVRVRRRPVEEKKLLDQLQQLGFEKVPANAFASTADFPVNLYGLDNEEAWRHYSASLLPRLHEAGWEVIAPADFRHHSLAVDAWDAELSENDGGWFDLDMGVVVGGKRLPLAPLLHALFRRDPRWLDAIGLAGIADNTQVELFGPTGERIQVAAARLKPIARTLIDLFDGPPGERLRLSKLDAPRLAELTARADMKHWQFKGDEAVQSLAERLQAGGGVQPVAAPAGLALTLRPYQQEGLSWLQYLRAQGLAGILADDMGLGKTAQTLAHLLAEKEAGRLDLPALIVLPTSLIFNWKREAERFAPSLRVLSLHGADRAERFEQIAEHDVCLTTYPLLWRDQDILTAQHYHLLILDEAQTVKNASSQAAQVVRLINTRHRLCLTGTPLENHLGELWAQFDFLLPGFLGDSKRFANIWRTPIEKYGDNMRRDLLAKRLKPFILRRKKDEVAKELPEKTIIVRSVELTAGQRDLYETVRSTMDARVREEIAARGFARSQIVILDALLKLRQVCCDPRLLKSPAASRVKERAKLDLLFTMLPEMVEEGRRILLFSQFTSMLELIAAELDKHGLGYATLTGDTRDRETPINKFQNGEVPIFLISLKAGGVGLNLTTADTVIHYDPWWNPAVENQATDRAHRLGQTKKVFVYKLVVAGSIEEKILALQEKKAELAAGILAEDHQGSTKFSSDDLAALLAPLPK